MNSDINLISNKNTALEKELRRLRIVRVLAVISLFVVALIAIMIFILNVTLPFDSVRKDEQMTKAGLSLLQNKLYTYASINDRVNNISNIISQRDNYIPQINQVLSKVPADLSVGELSVVTGKMDMSVSGLSLVSINKFIDDIVALGNQGKVIKNIVIQGLSVDPSGSYTLHLEADIVKAQNGT